MKSKSDINPFRCSVCKDKNEIHRLYAKAIRLEKEVREHKSDAKKWRDLVEIIDTTNKELNEKINELENTFTNSIFYRSPKDATTHALERKVSWLEAENKKLKEKIEQGLDCMNQLGDILS
jgi:chromosome segregation ATPase